MAVSQAQATNDRVWLMTQQEAKYFGIYDLNDYFKSDANYIAGGGTFEKLANSGSYQIWTSDLGIFYKPSRRWTLRVGLQIANPQSRGGGFSRTNSGLSLVDTAVSADFYLRRRWHLLPELSLVVPLHRVDLNSDEVLMGEGATEIQGLLRSHWKMRSIEPYILAGVLYRDQGRATLAPFGIGGEIPIGEHRWGAELGGNTVLTSDTNDTPERKKLLTTVDGGSYKFYAPNSRLLESRFWYHYVERSGLDLLFGAAFTLNGDSAAAGYRLTAGFGWAWGGRPAPSQQDTNGNRSTPSSNRIDDDDGSNFKFDEPLDTTTIPDPPRKPKTTKQQLNEVEITLERSLDNK